MLFKIDSAIFDLFPEVRIAVVTALAIDNRGADAQIAGLIGQAAGELTQSFRDTPVTEHSRISPWRAAYRGFGAKPKKYLSSIENLARRTIKGESLRKINKLVDIYNMVSLRHILPVGGEDLERIVGDIVLTRAGETEAPVKLLGESEERAPSPGEVIYKDDVGAICRRWNWKEADRTKLTETTSKAVLVIEALPPVTRQELEAAAGELADLVEKHCRGTTSFAILDKSKSEVALNESLA